MRRILLCVFLGIMTSAPLASAQNQNAAITHLSDLSRQNQIPQLIEAANSLFTNEKLSPPEQAIVFTFLAHAHKELGDFHQATAEYEKALAILERDGAHPVEYATALAALGILYADTGQTDAAKHMLLRSVHLLEKDGNQHAETAWLWNDLATIAADERSNREAHKCMTHALAELRLVPDPSPDETLTITTTQAKIAQIDSDSSAAIAGYQKALSLSKQIHGEQHPQTAMLYVLLGDAYLEAGDIASARQMTTRGLSLLEESSSRQSRRYLAAQLAYSKILDASGSHDEASKLRKEAQTAMKTESSRAQGEISIAALR